MAKALKCMLAAAVIATTSVALADTVILKSGDTFTGTIEKITTESVEVNTPFAGKITVKREAVRTLRSEERVTVVEKDGAVRRAFIAPVEKGAGWREQDVVAPAIAAMTPVTPAPVAVVPVKTFDLDLERYCLPVGPHWKNQFALGVINTTGNTESTNIAAELALNYADKPMELNIKIGGVYDTTEGTQTAGKFYFDAVARRILPEIDKDERWYLFAENHELYDAIKEISYRITNGVGLGYYVLKDPKGLTLDLRAGPAYVCEKFFNGDTESSMSGLAGLRAMYVINERCTLSEEALYTVSLQDSSNYQITSETALGVKLPEIARGVGLKLAFRDDYDNASSARKRNDTRFTLALTLDF